MLGEKVGEFRGKITGQRVLPPEGSHPKFETSVDLSGTIVGVAATLVGTYWSVLRPDGRLYGENPGQKENRMRPKHEQQSSGISRRQFLNALGTAAALASAPHFLKAPIAYAHEDQRRRFVRLREDRFGRMFPNLNPFFRENTRALQDALLDIGRAGGVLDAKDELGDGGEAAAIALIANPALNVNNPNNLAQTAGTTFMGQFIDHDLTFDQTSALAVETRPASTPNERNPRFDLDTVYGDGPYANPEIYERPARRREHPTTLRIEFTSSTQEFEDVPRHPDGTAIIADPRNDQNMMLQGLLAAMILFHNNAVDCGLT